MRPSTQTINCAVAHPARHSANSVWLPKNPWPGSATAVLCLLLSSACLAASAVYVPQDGNSRIDVLAANPGPEVTTVLYDTRPDLGDANSGKPCSMNIYAMRLAPGLARVASDTVAAGVCGFMGTRARLLKDGSLLVLAPDHLAVWRGGERASNQPLKSLAATRGMRINPANGPQSYDLAENGDSVFYQPGPKGAVVLGLDPKGAGRWRLTLQSSGDQLTVQRIWAGSGGGALLQALASPSNATMMANEMRLYPVNAAGQVQDAIVVTKDKPLDTKALSALKPGDWKRRGKLMKDSYMEGIKKIRVAAASGGGFDVLVQRTSGSKSRAGHYFYRIDGQGRLLDSYNLTEQIGRQSLEGWTDFYAVDDHLVLLGEVTAPQSGITSRRKLYDQIVVSRIALKGGVPDSRLVPLDRRYLEVAMNTGDEQLKNLANRPGGAPVALTRIGTTPLAIAIGFLQHRSALRFDEVTPDLLAWQ